jgi:hypothetical protein
MTTAGAAGIADMGRYRKFRAARAAGTGKAGRERPPPRVRPAQVALSAGRTRWKRYRDPSDPTRTVINPHKAPFVGQVRENPVGHGALRAAFWG